MRIDEHRKWRDQHTAQQNIGANPSRASDVRLAELEAGLVAGKASLLWNDLPSRFIRVLSLTNRDSHNLALHAVC